MRHSTICLGIVLGLVTTMLLGSVPASVLAQPPSSEAYPQGAEDRDLSDEDLPDGDLPDQDLPDTDLPDGDLPDQDLPDGDLPSGDDL
jgi:hypothetical protein